jgi:hypothetical protein
MKVYKNIEKAKNFRPELKKVIDDLVPLRDNRSATEAYYDEFLETDRKYRIWCDDKRDWEMNRNSDRKFPDFKLPKGAIAPDEARAFRKALLEVISDDKYSFGYLYFLLASEVNREAKRVVLPCVPDDERIKYATKFDIDEVYEEIKAIDDLNERIDCLEEWGDYSDIAKYNGELKTDFENQIKVEIKKTKRKIKSLKRKNSGQKGPITEIQKEITAAPQQTKQKVNITEEGKEILKHYFISSFKGMGNNNVNYFDDCLIPDLKKDRTAKEYATIAKLMFHSREFNKQKKPRSFSKWYEIFCNCLGIEKKTYKPNVLDTSLIEPIFYYLHPEFPDISK